MLAPRLTSAHPGDGAMIASGDGPPKWRTDISRGAMALSSLTYLAYGYWEKKADSMPLDVSPPKALSKAILIAEWMIWAFGCPWVTDPSNNSKPGVSNSTEAGNLIWIPAILIPGLDTGMYIYSRRLRQA